MAALNFIITNSGLSLLSQVSTVGPVTINKVAIGSAGYVEAASQTALVTQIKQLTPDGSSVTAPGIIHITASDSSTDAYAVKEIGLYAGTTLFAIYSDTTAFLTKTATNTALFSVDLVLSNVPAGVLTTGLVSSNNSLTISSSITNAQVGVAFVQAGNNTALSVSVSGNNITVNLATGATGLITSTATTVRTAILANTSAAALVSVSNTSGSSGAGIVTAFAMTYLASVTIGQAVFNYPAATESTPGVAKIATSALVTAGADDSTFVTPLKLASRLSSLPSAFVRLIGDSMTGFLTLVGNPTSALHASPKQYVDAADALKVSKSGDSMTGFLSLVGDPTSALHTATKQYVDTSILFTPSSPTGSASGYVRLAGGLIFQWKHIVVAAATSTAFTWPIAFPTAVLTGQICKNGDNNGQVIQLAGISTTQGVADNSGGTATNGAFVLGIGY